MATMPSIRMRRSALAVACAGATLVSVAGLTGAVGAAATPMTTHHAVVKHHAVAKKARQAKVVAGSRYLALGDSVPFGFRESKAIPTSKNDYSKPKTFIGYPEDIAKNLGLKVANLACPGETTSSLINPKKPSNGCENSFNGTKQVKGGYATVNPLHVKYKDTTKNNGQLATAVKFLKAHKNVRLVSLMIGANDGFLCLEHGASCNLGAAVAKISKNATHIFRAIRNKGHYSGQIVLVNYYSTDYSSAAATGQSKLLNSALVAAAKPFKVEVANSFGAFRKASQQAGGKTCTAQLLTQLKTTPSSCGVHPSVSGQALLAQAVEQAIKK